MGSVPTALSRQTGSSVCALIAAGVFAAGCGATPSEAVVTQLAESKPKVLRIATPYAEADAPKFAAATKRFERENNVKIEAISYSGDLVDQLSLSVQSLNPPDMAVVPQPGVVSDLFSGGVIKAVPATQIVRTEQNVSTDLTKLSHIKGHQVSVWLRVSAPFVWYRADIFAREGWAVPRTLNELETLVDQVGAEGRYVPWCVGLGAGGATGWALTDTLELLVLSALGVGAYDDWVVNKLKTSSPEIVGLLRKMQRWYTAPGFLDGSVEEVIERPVEMAFAQLADEEPKCLMNISSDWVLDQIDPQVAAGVVKFSNETPSGALDTGTTQIGHFGFPGPVPGRPSFSLGGDQLVSLVDDPMAWSFMAYVADPRWGIEWASEGNFISPNLDFDETMYRGTVAREEASAVASAGASRFDGADVMPKRVGSAAMWSGMVDLIRGSKPEVIAEEIDAAWVEAAR